MDQLERSALNRAQAALSVALGGMPADTSAGEFVQLAKSLMIAGSSFGARDVVPANCSRARAVLEKASVGGASLNSPDWGNELAGYGSLVDGFITALRGLGAFDSMIPSMRRVPLRTRLAVSSSGATGSSDSDGVATPIGKLQLANQWLEPLRATAIIVLTNELLRVGGAAANVFLASELKRACIATTDRTFLATITSGAAVTLSTGTAATNVVADLASLLAQIDIGDSSKLFLIAQPDAVARLALRMQAAGYRDIGVNGGQLAGITVVPSSETADVVVGSPEVSLPTAILADADAIVFDDATLTLDATTRTTIEMSSTPSSRSTVTGSPEVPVGSTAVSMFQTGGAALKATRWLGAEVIRSGVAVLTGVQW